jgi:hypothetical protein
MSEPEPKRPVEPPQREPKAPPLPVDGPVDPGSKGADPDYLPGRNQQPEDLPDRNEPEPKRGALLKVSDRVCAALACAAAVR